MDEQHRRRRRAGDAQQPEQTIEPQDEPKQEASPAEADASGAQAHPHRRRRRGEAQEEPAQREAARSADDPAESDDVFWHPYEEDTQAAQPQERGAKAKRSLGVLSWIDGAVCKAGDACLAAIKWSGVGLLYAAGFVARGAGKLMTKAKRVLRSTGKKTDRRTGVHTGKRFAGAKRAPAQAAAQQPEITIEPTRPEDYRGMGDMRSSGGKRQKRVVRAPQKRVSPIYSAAMALFICVALVSVYMIGSIVWRSISTKRLSSELSQRYSELSAANEEKMEEDEAQSVPENLVIYTAQATDEPTESIAPDGNAQAAMPGESAAPPAQESATAAPKTQEIKKDAVRSTKFHQVGGDALPEMEALYADNRDLIGWLRMEGILDLPVVYRDNEYYLTRDFYKNKSASGTLFLDENHPFKENAQNLLLHGHNMKDGTMFGRLVQYETNLQFLKNNPFIQYSTLWRKEQYVIFAVLHVSLNTRSTDYFNYYSYHTFSSDKQFEGYVRALQNRSEFSIPIDVDPSDALLTLSTCLDDDRLVIVARRLREGESKSEIRHLVQLADRQ